MDNSLKKDRLRRQKRALRVRAKLFGTAEKPRLSVHKSRRFLTVQLIDDECGVTLASASTLSKDFVAGKGSAKNKEAAVWLGEQIAVRAKEKNIESVVFDRGALKYHGVIASLAERARESGLRV